MSGHPTRRCAICGVVICDDGECKDVLHVRSFQRFAGDEWRWCGECVDRAELLWACARIRELEATLANERGEGDPPSPGWRPDPTVLTLGCWTHVDGRCCYRLTNFDYIVVRRGSMGPELAYAKTAREAMRAADQAAKEEG
jgi:hypothetical protein